MVKTEHGYQKKRTRSTASYCAHSPSRLESRSQALPKSVRLQVSISSELSQSKNEPFRQQENVEEPELLLLVPELLLVSPLLEPELLELLPMGTQSSGISEAPELLPPELVVPLELLVSPLELVVPLLLVVSSQLPPPPVQSPNMA